MGFLSKLFGRKPPKSEADLIADGQAFLHELTQLMETDIKAAMRFAGRQAGGALEPVFDFGAPLHQEFTAAILALTAKRGGTAVLSPAQLPPVQVVTDPDDAILETLLSRAGQNPNDVFFIRNLETGDYVGWRDTALAVEALAEFVYEPSTALVYIGDEHVLARDTVLAAVSQTGGPALTSGNWHQKLGDRVEALPGAEFIDGFRTELGYELMVYRIP